MGLSLRALFRRPVLDALSEDEKSVVIVWIPSRPKHDYQPAGNGRAILVDDPNRRGKDLGLWLVMTGFGEGSEESNENDGANISPGARL